MGRVGYAILLLILLAGCAYVFWPEPVARVSPPLWQAAIPTRYQVTAGTLVQQVDGDRVRIGEVVRPLARARHEELWAFIRTMSLDEALVVVVPEDRLAAYGIDGTRELAAADGLRLRWGALGDDGYVWLSAGARLVPCDRALLARLDEATRRLDQARLLDLTQIRKLGLDGLELELERAAWYAARQGERPHFNRRVNRLFDLLEGLRLDDFSRTQAPLAPPLHQLRLRASDLAAPEHLVRLWRDDRAPVAGQEPGGLVQVDTLPVQRLAPSALAQWNAALASFAVDHLFDLQTEFGLRPLGEVRAFDGDQLRFRLEKHGLNDVANGRSQWDVVWPGGREPASENAAPALALALDELVVREPRRRQAADAIPGTARRLVFVFKVDNRTLEIAFDGERVFSPTHVATAVALPPLLARLLPDDMLDQALTLRGAERVVKVQRRWHQGPRAGQAEVVAVGAGSGGLEGSWQQTWPTAAAGTPVSALAVDQLARALCFTRSRAVRLPTPEDRAVIAAPAFELDVRFAQAQVKLSNDHTRLSDTTDQDLGFAFAPEGEAWRAVDKESGISHLVDRELLDLLQAPLSDDLVLPLVPSLISRIEISGAAGRFALVRSDETWRLQPLAATGGRAGAAQPADAVEVRRYLRELTAVRALRADPEAGPLAPAQIQGSVLCTFPGSGEGDARVGVTLGQAVDHQVPAVVDGGGLRGMPRGRLYLAQEAGGALLPPATRFHARPAQPAQPAPAAP